ncbi:hypothetical protein I41_17940 [Lacipirellula limnantheis]|uniref:Uncharacterized protein n=1 Tax=Lacipirellula limnantheis TaxID=2528024 RepID=A0A517TW68_9BACT|nr:hypothetical protein I41_17940 [Lacipirellula limnantheis]
MEPDPQSFRFSLRRLLTIVVAIAVGVALYQAAFGPPSMSRLFGGAENLAIVRESTRVEAYRLVPPPGSRPNEDDLSPFDFNVVAGPVVVPAEMANDLATTLLSPNTYDWDAAKACGYPVYGVKLSFFRGNDRVDVFFCFQCADLAVTRDGEKFGIGDFSPQERPFVAAVKQLFSDDAGIQAIRP